MSESVKVIADKQDLVSIADAIRAKTETTDGINFADMAALIEGISAGAKVATGSFILDSSTAPEDYEITHGLGVIPKYLIIYTDTLNASLKTLMASIFPMGDGSYRTLSYYSTSSSSSAIKKETSGSYTEEVMGDGNTITYPKETSGKLAAASSYEWVVIG